MVIINSKDGSILAITYTIHVKNKASSIKR